MPGYFSHLIEKPTHHETLEASLAALTDEVRFDVLRHHTKIVRSEVERLTNALEMIAKGFPCQTMEDMQRMAREAIPTQRR